jgi:hypothetical protein
MATQTTDNENIVYKANKRNLICLWIGNILPAGLPLSLAIVMFMADDPKSTGTVFVEILLFAASIYILLKSLTFKELIIYKDRVVVDRFIFKKIIIDIKNIARVNIEFSVISNVMMLIYNDKNDTSSLLQYSIAALTNKQVFEIKDTIKTLKQEKNNV